MNEKLKKHLRVLLYLAISGALAYLASVFANKPEYIFAAPFINYALYAITQELRGEGIINEMLKR